MADLADKYPSPHWTVIRQRVALAGVVSDEVSGAPIVGARVEITNGPHSARQTTRADGSYVFSGLPVGNYGLRASIPAPGGRYGAVTTDAIAVTDARDADGRLTVAAWNPALPPTRIHGTVKGKASGKSAAPLASARVQVRGGRYSATTDGGGSYALSPLEAGKLTLEFSAPGFKSASVTLSLTAGNDLTQDITLDFVVPPKKTNGG